MARGVPKETKLVAKMVKALRLKSGGLGFWIKIHGGLFQASGLPDIIGCYKGRFFAFEVKLPGREDNLTELQSDRIKEIKQAQGVAKMVTSIDEIFDAVEDSVGWD